MTNTRPTEAALRRDGNAHYYNQIHPPAAHFIEQTVAVHLRLSDDGTRWIVDGPSVDGYPLDSTYAELCATNSECACDRPAEAPKSATAPTRYRCPPPPSWSRCSPMRSTPPPSSLPPSKPAAGPGAR